MKADLEQLQKDIASIAEEFPSRLPTGPFSLGQLRLTADKCAGEVRSRIDSIAREIDRSPLCVVRNLIATSSNSTLSRFRELLEHWETNNPLEPAKVHHELIALIPSVPEKNDMFRWQLLGVGPTPSLRAAVSCFKGNLSHILGYEREVVRRSKPRKVADTITLLRTVISTGDFSATASDNQVIQAEGFAKGLAQIDEAGFAKMPQSERRWILDKQGFCKIALVPSLHQAIWSNPLAHKDTPEAIEVQEWHHNVVPSAMNNLGRRSFESTEVEQLLQRADINDYSERILSSLRNKRAADAWQTDNPILTLPKNAVGNVNKRLASALLFFTKPLEGRLSVIASLSDEEIVQLSTDVSSDDWLAAVSSSNSLSSLKRVGTLCDTDAAMLSLIFRQLTKEKISEQFFNCFAPGFIRKADATKLHHFFSKKPGAFAFCESELLELPEFQKFVEKSIRSPSAAQFFLRHIPKKLHNRLFASSKQWIQGWRQQLAILAGKCRTPALKQEVLGHLVRFCPELIEAAFGWKCSPTTFEPLLKAILSENRGKGRASIFSFIEPGGTPCWERHLRKNDRARLLRPLIRRERPDLVRRLNELDAAILLTKPSFLKKLERKLAGKDDAPIGLSRDVLVEMLPWVWKKWRKKQTLAVAYELAMAFSLRDARYLVALCATRWKSPDRDKGGYVFDQLYKTHSIPKKSGGVRPVNVPDAGLKRLQRRILENGFNGVGTHPAAHGFKRGCSILTNATPHVGKSCVVNADIESFFPSTKYPHILRACSLLLEGRLSEAARHVVADLCSYNGALPTGAPTSPAMGNLVLRAADAAITKAAGNNGITYTRYADDLTFSGDSNAVKILPFVKKVTVQVV